MKDKQALREVAEKATKGEWWSDVVETDGEYGEGEDRVSGYHSYAVYVGHESLLDMINSTAACIHTEWDHDYHMAWDETAKRNAEFIAAANPATVLALLDENIQLQREKDATEAVLSAMRDDMRQAREQLEAAEKLNAEQQRSLEHCKFLLSSTCEVQRDFAEALGCAGDNESIMEAIDDMKQRIAELESKLSNPVLLPKTNGYWNEQEKAYEEAITLAKRQVRLAGFSVEDM
ncbi:ead/Ea22-like family protein [Salmonella enterica subsp. enterica serovar Stanley]|nr:ead/Ea22-like family protein [Salmonella enterica subsp. enterica serovar Stanley]